MAVDIGTIIFVSVLVFLASFMDSIAGGGGIISLPAYVASGIPYHMCLGSNKFSAVFGSGFASFRFIKDKKVELKTATVSFVLALVGSALGSQTAMFISADALKVFFVIALPIIAVFILTRRTFGEENRSHEIPFKKLMAYAVFAGFVVGFYDGFFGPGTGTFLILIYTALMKFDLVTASGNAKCINFASNLASMVTFLINGQVFFPIAVPALFCSILGGYLGAGLAIKNGAKIIKPILVVVMVLLIGKIVLNMFGVNI